MSMGFMILAMVLSLVLLLAIGFSFQPALRRLNKTDLVFSTLSTFTGLLILLSLTLLIANCKMLHPRPQPRPSLSKPAAPELLRTRTRNRRQVPDHPFHLGLPAQRVSPCPNPDVRHRPLVFGARPEWRGPAPGEAPPPLRRGPAPGCPAVSLAVARSLTPL
ncbi:uncharacterized protein LOC129546497 isoform X3 [Moschus berezovskii]|nr:uncharacterized protein LOC129546497 isoform X3 [Moschus berezovskii]